MSSPWLRVNHFHTIYATTKTLLPDMSRMLNQNYEEQLVAYENLRLDYDDLRIIITNQSVSIVTNTSGPTLERKFVCNLSALEKCITLSERNIHYIEITIHEQTLNKALVYQNSVKNIRFRCGSQELATNIVQQLNYAKRLYDEQQHTLQIDNIPIYED